MALASNTKGTVTEPSLIAFSQYITYLRENKERKSLSPKINATRYNGTSCLIFIMISSKFYFKALMIMYKIYKLTEILKYFKVIFDNISSYLLLACFLQINLLQLVDYLKS